MYYLMTMLTSAGILMIAGTGALLSIRCGAMNLGGEGQIYAGGFAGCAVLVYVQGPSPLVFALALAASLASGSLLGLLSALLWEKPAPGRGGRFAGTRHLRCKNSGPEGSGADL